MYDSLLNEILETAKVIQERAISNNSYIIVSNQTASSLDVLTKIQDGDDTAYSGGPLHYSFAEWKQYLFSHEEDLDKLEKVKTSVEWLTGTKIKNNNKIFKSKERELRALYLALRHLDKMYNELCSPISAETKELIRNAVIDTHTRIYPTVAIGKNIKLDNHLDAIKINYTVTQ